MKPFYKSLFAMLIALALLTPIGAIAEDLELELEPEPEQIALDDGSLELPADFADFDPLPQEALILDDLQPLQLDPGASSEKGRPSGGESIARTGEEPSVADEDSVNAARYGVPAGLTLGVKETYAIRCTASGKLTYKTANKKIATVNSKGVITGKKEGIAVITVYARGKKLTTCRVRVVPAPKRVTLNKTKLSLEINNTFRLAASVNSGSHARYTWSSSNKYVAAVSNTGVVTAKAAGKATISVRTHNGKKATCKVTVTQAPGDTLRVSPASVTLYEGETQDATVTFTASGKVRWTTSNQKIATCTWGSSWNGDDIALIVHGHSAGTATITLTNDANYDTDILTVTVVQRERKEEEATLSVSPTEVSMVSGESRDVTVTFTGSGTVYYSSSDESIATCAQTSDWNGDNATLTVYGHSAGAATITLANSVNSSVATLNVIVTAPDEEGGQATLSVSPSEVSMASGDSRDVTVTFTGSGTVDYSISDESIATCAWASDWVGGKATLTIYGHSAGSAAVTITNSANSNTATVYITVSSPQEEGGESILSVSPSEVSMNSGESRDVTVTFASPVGSVHCASSDKSIATCAWTSEWNGDDTTLTVFGHSAGSATITITNSANSNTATLNVTVNSPEEAEGTGTLRVNPTALSVAAGETQEATITFTSSTGMVYFSISDESVATCNLATEWDGDNRKLTVYGHSAGTATITFTNTANNDTATLHVTVIQAQDPQSKGSDNTVKYRALLIGQEGFIPVCTRNRGDVTLMSAMLRSVQGPAGGPYIVTHRYDLNRAATLNAIKSAFAGADEDDVSLFFIATHGDSASSGSGAGALSMIDSGYEGGALLISDLANALRAVPGKVIVIIESCGSGAAIYDPGVSENSANAMRKAAAAFDEAVIRAFSRADPGQGAPSPNTGELRLENKFYVLTATRYHEDSYGTEIGPYNYFTKWLTDGIGTSGKMPADANADGETTLSELFIYISSIGDDSPFVIPEGTFYQHVQVYPKDSAYPLFKR